MGDQACTNLIPRHSYDVGNHLSEQPVVRRTTIDILLKCNTNVNWIPDGGSSYKDPIYRGSNSMYNDSMSAYRTASFYRVAAYLRINGEKSPLGFFRVGTINPIKEDLLDLQIVPTREGRKFLIHLEDHDCSKLPKDLIYVDQLTAKGICQFILDHAHKTIYVMDDERPIWEELFGKINYGISIRGGKLRFKGMNGHNILNVG